MMWTARQLRDRELETMVRHIVGPPPPTRFEFAILRGNDQSGMVMEAWPDGDHIVHTLMASPEDLADRIGAAIANGGVGGEARFLRALAEHVRDERAKDAMAAAGSP